MKVLLALDGSPPALVARDLVAKVPWPDSTVIHVASAYEMPVDWTGGIGSITDWVGAPEDAVRDQLTEDLAIHAAPLAERGLTVERHVVRARAADAILGMAEELRVDLIVTGSRGRSRLRSILLGSVAAEVSADARCPVLVARGTDVSRVLVATDGSAPAKMIPQRLVELGIVAGQPTDVLAVSVPDSPAFELAVSIYTLGDERLAKLRQELELLAGRDADEMARDLTERGMPATAHARSGDPAAEIVAAAKDLGADLIVIGSRGLGTVERVVLGSVARNVLLHADCSVLIVRGVPVPA